MVFHQVVETRPHRGSDEHPSLKSQSFLSSQVGSYEVGRYGWQTKSRGRQMRRVDRLF